MTSIDLSKGKHNLEGDAVFVENIQAFTWGCRCDSPR
jgi:hypothetical protein